MEKRSVYILMLLVGVIEAALVGMAVFWHGNYFYLFQVIVFAPAVLLMIVCFLAKVRIGVAPGTPNQVLSTMAHNFRTAQYRVTDKGQSFTVQGGSDYGIRVFAEPAGSASVVLARSDPTPTGWGILMILFIFTYSIGTVPMSLYLFRKSQKFGLSLIPVMYKHPGEAIVDGAFSKTKACLIDTLSEGYRLSSEAYESVKSNYEDNLILGSLLGLATSVIVLLTSVWILGGGIGWETQLLISLMLGAIAGFTVSLAIYLHLRRKVRPELISLDQWAKKMKEELVNEVSQVGPGDRHESTFEVLLDASKQVPGWLRIRRKSGLFRSPIIWLLILMLGIYGFEYLMIAVMNYWANPIARVAIASVSVGLIAISIALYMFWRRKQDSEVRMISETWQQRTDAMRRKMDEMIRDL